ncbi:MAG TPA: GNAT family N-acetyltransferase [Gaiellaceae bacterium]|nr:GNAT family N-acetyltransferase [Gaiellaceae bacterium]
MEIDPRLAEEWDSLADRAGAAPWMRPGWVAAWWKAFGSGELELVAVRSEYGELTGVLPVARRRGRVSALANWHSPELPLTAAEGMTATLLEKLLAARPRSAAFRFPADDAAAAIGIAAGTAGYRLLDRVAERSPYVDVAGSFEDYLATLDRHHVKETLRRRRRLGDEGEVEFSVEDGREHLDELLAEGLPVEASGWKRESGTAIDSQAETLGFYTEVARWAAARGILRLAFLRLGGRAIAFELALEDNGVYAILKGGFDVELRKFGPGGLITYEQLARAFELGLRRYEFLGTDETYKTVWTPLAHERRVLQAFAPTPAGFVERAAFEHGRPLAKRLLRR